jgi:hypothetical protein
VSALTHPRKRPTPRMGKGAMIGARVTLETRKALEEEATRSGRSMSEVAEAWIHGGRLWEALQVRIFRGHVPLTPQELGVAAAAEAAADERRRANLESCAAKLADLAALFRRVDEVCARHIENTWGPTQ